MNMNVILNVNMNTTSRTYTALRHYLKCEYDYSTLFIFVNNIPGIGFHLGFIADSPEPLIIIDRAVPVCPLTVGVAAVFANHC